MFGRASMSFMREAEFKWCAQLRYPYPASRFLQILNKVRSIAHFMLLRWQASELAVRCTLTSETMVTRHHLNKDAPCHRTISDIPHELLELKDSNRQVLNSNAYWDFTDMKQSASAFKTSMIYTILRIAYYFLHLHIFLNIVMFGHNIWSLS